MNVQMVLDLTQKTILVAALAAAPMLLTSMVVGVVINILQTVTQIRDMSLTFVPKVAVAAVVLALTLPWALNLQIEFCADMLRTLGTLNK